MPSATEPRGGRPVRSPAVPEVHLAARTALLSLMVCAALAACALPTAPITPTGLAPEGTVPPLLRVVACASAEPYARSLAEAWTAQRSDVYVDVTVANPSVALEMLRSGDVGLALITRRPAEPAAVLEEDLLTASVGHDGLAVVAAAGHDLRTISQADIAAAYGGYLLDWSSLGLAAGAVEVVAQDVSSTARAQFDEAVLGGQEVTSAAVLVADDRAAIEYVAAHPGAIGYASASLVAAQASPPSVRAVEITMAGDLGRVGDTALYPASQEIVLVTPVAMSREAYALRAYALGREGRRIAEAYLVP